MKQSFLLSMRVIIAASYEGLGVSVWSDLGLQRDQLHDASTHCCGTVLMAPVGVAEQRGVQRFHVRQADGFRAEPAGQVLRVCTFAKRLLLSGELLLQFEMLCASYL
jgi:hypothetical protein